MKAFQILTACTPLLFCACASTKTAPPIQQTATPVPEAVIVQPNSNPRMTQLIDRIEELERENSELRMQLLQNVLTR